MRVNAFYLVVGSVELELLDDPEVEDVLLLEPELPAPAPLEDAPPSVAELVPPPLLVDGDVVVVRLVL